MSAIHYYLIIGIVVSIAETSMACLDMKKLGLTIYDICPEPIRLIRPNKIVIVLVIIAASIAIAIIWPVQVYHWIRRFILHNKV